MKKLLQIFLLLIPVAVSAQHKNIPLNREAFIFSAEYLNKKNIAADSVIHTSFKPIVESDQLSLPRYIYNNYYLYNRINAGYKYKMRENELKPYYTAKDPDRFRSSGSPVLTYLGYKLRKESFIWIQPKAPANATEEPLHFNLTIDPLFNLEGGSTNDDSIGVVYRNTRGVLVRGDIGKQFSFETSFYENQAKYPDYIAEFVDSFNVAPGQGRVKKFKSNAYDFAMSSGYVSYSPGKHVNIQLGHGKHFVGDGYRSLLLSDNSFNYPYARITTTFGRFQYVNLYTSFMNLSDGGVKTPAHTERLFQKKSGAFQMLNIIAHKRVQVGFFQGMIWQSGDTLNKQHLDFFYFNPLIGVSALRYGLNNSNNVMLGATLKLKVTKGIMVYSQLVVDDIPEKGLKGSLRNKTGYQAGFYAFNLFRLKNLHLQAEYNSVMPYTYSHKRPGQSYTHYNQPLAHPLGANFTEAVGILTYRLSDVFVEVKYNYAKAGIDSAGYNYGNNVFLSNNQAAHGLTSTVNEQLQGVSTTITHKDIRIGYVINPVTNMNITLGVSVRDFDNMKTLDRTNYYYVSFRTSLNNIYYDF